MKVFVVIDESVYQMESDVFVKVSLNYKSAKKYFDDTVKESKENDHLFVDLEDEDLVVEESEITMAIKYSQRKFPKRNTIKIKTVLEAI